MKKKVNVILPFPTKRPNGGPKIMYIYANLLAKKGYDVHIYHSLNTYLKSYKKPYFIRKILHKIRKTHRPNWYELSSEVKSSNIKRVSNQYIRDADYVLSTWWATALEVNDLDESKGKKINFIQDYENWKKRKDLLIKSYRLKNTTNIAISTFVYDIIAPLSTKKAYKILNAIEASDFHITKNIEEREPSILMMFSRGKRKGSIYGIEALTNIKKQYPHLNVTLFSTGRRPKQLYKKINFYRKPKDLKALYNAHSIFVTPSINEGFGLPPCEALACGCALIATDLEGHQDFAIHNKTALTVTPKNPTDIEEKIKVLLNNDDLRIKLAKNGNQFLLQNFSWERNIKQLEYIFQNI